MSNSLNKLLKEQLYLVSIIHMVNLFTGLNYFFKRLLQILYN